MTDVKVSSQTFHRRLAKVVDVWKTQIDDAKSPWHGVKGLLAIMGSPDDENPYQKTAALHSWLLGYEFPATLLLLTPAKMTIVTSGSKAKFLDGLNSGSPVPVELLKRAKDAGENKNQLDQVCEQLKDLSKIGVFSKDSYGGKFVDEWKASFDSVASNIEQVDISAGLGPCLAVKDEDEVKNMRSASKATLRVMNGYFVDQMSTIIDQEKNVKHSVLAERVERVLDDQKFMAKLASDPGFDQEQLEWCYTPIIQSGGEYDLKPSALSNDSNLTGGVIICSMGLRYKSYCSNVGRTYLIDPSQDQSDNYDFLIKLQQKVLDSMKPGAVLKDVYQAAVKFVDEQKPALASHLVKNFGCGIGIDFRDTSLTINAKNETRVEAGMTFNVSVGLSNITNSKAKGKQPKTFSLLLIDLIKVTNDKIELLTDSKKARNDVTYFFNDESEAEVERPSKRGGAAAVSGKALDTGAILAKKTRGAGQPQVNEQSERRRRDHQKELAAKLQDEGVKRFPDGESTTNGQTQVAIKKYESYRRETQLPSTLNSLKIVVDQRAQTVIVPIFGRPVPFHINAIKNSSKNEEGEFVYLRLNLLSPGQVSGRKDDTPFEHPEAHFVRSLTFRSSDVDRMNEISRQILEMKRVATKREAERKELADVVEQEDLVEVKNRRPQKLLDVFVRPGLDGKRVTGELEIHQNGLRYQSPVRTDQRIDLLFSNIKHLFYQPCDHELIVLIHVHLKDPIMIAKRKTRDVQFYREASEVQFDDTANRKRKHKYGDEDELEQEQDERRRRAQLNKEFKAFAEKIAEASDGRLDVDIPFRELGFNGVPHRSNVLLQPTTDCLVHLTDTPFSVITLSEIEIVHLERIQFGLKNFDMVFVFKDFTKAPVHVNTVPMSSVDNVREWLDSTDIVTTEGPLNLNWGTIMKTVNDDPSGFFQEGGWAFLAEDSDAESDDEEDDDDAYVQSSSESEDDAESESEVDDDASDGSYEEEEDEDMDDLIDEDDEEEDD